VPKQVAVPSSLGPYHGPSRQVLCGLVVPSTESIGRIRIGSTTYMLIITYGVGPNTTCRVLDMHVHVQTYMLIITCVLRTQHDMSYCWHACTNNTYMLIITYGVAPNSTCRVVDVNVHVQPDMLITTCVFDPTRHHAVAFLTCMYKRPYMLIMTCGAGPNTARRVVDMYMYMYKHTC
jgi:hypothetical protein